LRLDAKTLWIVRRSIAGVWSILVGRKPEVARATSRPEGWVCWDIDIGGAETCVYLRKRRPNFTNHCGLLKQPDKQKPLAAGIASQVSCLATLDELALAARDPSKKVHRCILIGHSFGGLLLGNTISHSILDASGFGTRNTSPWDMAVTFNSADSSISTRQLMKELDYLYQYDPIRHAWWIRTGQ
jgi:hypothetical protein